MRLAYYLFWKSMALITFEKTQILENNIQILSIVDEEMYNSFDGHGPWMRSDLI